MEPYAGRIQLGGPAISAAGLAWLQDFVGLCSACTIDFQPVHWYNTASNYAWFTAFLNEAYALGPAGRHLWLTEVRNLFLFFSLLPFSNLLHHLYCVNTKSKKTKQFQGSGTQADQITFLEAVMPYMDAADWIDGYSWYGVFDGNLVSEASDGDEEINALGEVFDTYYSTDVIIT